MPPTINFNTLFPPMQVLFSRIATNKANQDEGELELAEWQGGRVAGWQAVNSMLVIA